MRRIALSLLCALTCSGCARTAVVQYWEPARVDVSRMQRIVVLDFGGDRGSDLAATLSEGLSENRFYSVVDRAILDNRIQPAAHADGEQGSLKDALKYARAQNVDGLLLADVVERSCEDEIVQQTSFRPWDSSEEQPDGDRSWGAGLGWKRQETLVRTGVVTISFRLVSVNESEIRAAQQVTQQYRGQQRPEQDSLPSQDEVLAQLTQDCLEEMVKLLAPHQSGEEMELARGDLWDRGKNSVRQGVLQAQEGNWEAAQQQWREALRVEPENHAALFNLAVAAAHEQDYAAAEDLAMQALRIQHRAQYAAGLETIRARRDGFTRAEDQRESRTLLPTRLLW